MKNSNVDYLSNPNADNEESPNVKLIRLQNESYFEFSMSD